jgi:hypothetical protein
LSLLPVFTASSLLEANLPGGTSRPWVVSVMTEEGLDSYVLKPFSKKDNQQLPYLNKEVYASFIAQELEIDVPEPALIRITDAFLETLEEDKRERILGLRQRLFFGCKFYEGYASLGTGLDPKKFHNIQQDTIFAYDVLIRNFDRKKNKPNLLVSGAHCLCIDHDRSLDIQKTFGQYLDLRLWDNFTVVGDTAHLFHDTLKTRKRQARGKEVDFAEFKTSFKTFSTKTLDKVVDIMTDNGIFTDDYELVRNYLGEVSGDKERFYKLLNLLIS